VLRRPALLPVPRPGHGCCSARRAPGSWRRRASGLPRRPCPRSATGSGTRSLTGRCGTCSAASRIRPPRQDRAG